jgi:hypothetical protein
MGSMPRRKNPDYGDFLFRKTSRLLTSLTPFREEARARRMLPIISLGKLPRDIGVLFT